MSDSESYSEPDAVVIDRDDVSNYNPDNILPKPAEEIRQIRAWLEPTSYTIAGGEFRKHIASHAPGTGQWLASTDEYQKWLRGDGECGLLWIKGIPGSGKSVHVAKLIDDLAKENPGCPVLFFFFRQIIAANHSPQALVRDWMDQVLRYSPPLQHQLWKYIEDKASLSLFSVGDLLKDLQMAFRALPDKVFCIADALDEMDAGNEAFLQAIGSLGQWRPRKVKVLISSRPVPKVEAHLRQIPAFHIRLEERLVDLDISTYVNSTLSESHIPRGDWSAIANAVPGRANGLFLYARLAMEAFLEPGAHTETVLAHLPLDLDVLYTGLLQEHARRSGISPGVQRLILQSVTHATRPLRLVELAEMCRVVDSVGAGRDLRAMKDLIRAACGPLLEILPDETVSVVHHSFTEYLKGTTRGDDENGYPVLRPGPSHTQLALSCLRYLLMTRCLDQVEITIDDTDETPGCENISYSDRVPDEVKELRMKFPFFFYATSNWYLHIQGSEAESHAQDTINQVLDQFLGTDKTIKAWLKMVWPSSAANARRFSALHLVGRFGLVAYTRKLAKGWPGDVNPCDIADQPSAMLTRPVRWWAASEGHAATVSELISAGADPNRIDDWMKTTPLYEAADKNHDAVIKVLLGAGVDPLAPPSPSDDDKAKMDKPAFRSACERGHVEAVDAFLPHIDMKAMQDCLTWAAQAGQSRVVTHMLSQPGIEIDHMDHGSTSLFKACMRRDLATVKALLAAGANPRLLNGLEDASGPKAAEASCRQFTSLHVICGLRDHAYGIDYWADWDDDDSCEMARLVIEHGVDIHLQIEDGTTALHYAVGRSYHLSRLLLESGASAQVDDIRGRTPLHHCRAPACVPLLVEEGGADVNAQDVYGDTPLVAAFGQDRFHQDGLESQVLLLLECGADARVLTSAGESTLHLALESYQAIPTIIQALLENGADPERRNRCSETALMVASRCQDAEKIWASLLAAGADIHARDRVGHSVLWHQATRWPVCQGDGRWSHGDVQFLLDHGADPHSRDSRGRTLLHQAIRKRPSSCSPSSRSGDDTDIPRFSFLLGLGLDHTIVDYNGNSLLHELAAREASPYPYVRDWVLPLWEQLVCTLGLDLNQQNHLGSTPLHILCDAHARPGSLGHDDEPEPIDFLILRMRDVHISDHAGQTALHIASARSEYCANKLLEAGLSPLATTHQGLTPLHLAARAQQSNIVGMLVRLLQKSRHREPRMDTDMSLQSGADDGVETDGIDATDENGFSPLYHAVRSGRPETVWILVKAGADTNAGRSLFEACRDFEQDNALRAATGHGSRPDPLTQRETKGEASDPAEGYSQLTSDSDVFSTVETSRLEEIVMLIVKYGADASQLKWNESYSDGFVGRCMWQGKAYTASCLFDRVPHSLWHEPSSISGSTTLLSTCAPEYDSSTSSKTFLPVVAGRPCVMEFMLFMRQRRYHLVKELAKRGARFLPDPRDKYHFSHFATLVRLGFTRLVKSIGTVEAERALGQGDWHAFGDSSKAGLWCANRPADEDEAEGRDLRRGPEPCEERIPKPFLLEAVECKLPNLDVVRLLVEDFHVDVNERTWTSEYADGCFRLFYGNSTLHHVAQGTHWWHVHQALEYLVTVPGIDINLRIGGGLTPLHVAIRGTNMVLAPRHRPYIYDSVERLLRAGADVHLKTNGGVGCLALATRNIKIMQLLIKHGAIVSPDAVVSAVQDGRVDALRTLLHAKDKEGQCPDLDLDPALRVAGMLFRKPDPDDNIRSPSVDSVIAIEMIEILIHHGANPLSDYLIRDIDSFHSSSLDYIHFKRGDPPPEASHGGREVTMMHELIQSIPEFQIQTFLVPGIDVNHRDPRGLTLLHAVCCRPESVGKAFTEGGQETTFQHLVALGADLSARDDRGRTVLTTLLGPCYRTPPGWRATLDDMIRLAPRLIHDADDAGDTPLIYAAGRATGPEADTEPVQRLLSAGASPLETNKNGDGVLHTLAKDLGTPQLRQLCRLLVSHGADINSRNSQGETPLFKFAIRCPQVPGDRFDADFTKRNARGDAYEEPREQGAIALLQELGADFSAQDNEGRGLLHVAATGDVVRFQELMATGLDPMMENNAQQTAVDVAAAASNNSVLEIFENKARR
ncbi:hypothetical protein FZEAL_1865 [Fusarium zealandicum]|uniref:Nephrocystin 3-like N-terminal domain-containing protein n=1 Tax=Fusarium zealandicum TaxID=1053134 RepID=A0A8H4XNB3_9HYPO|nr:hypothetical protein FZEAL_1865 [Fusarium zealandicum]